MTDKRRGTKTGPRDPYFSDQSPYLSDHSKHDRNPDYRDNPERSRRHITRTNTGTDMINTIVPNLKAPTPDSTTAMMPKIVSVIVTNTEPTQSTLMNTDLHQAPEPTTHSSFTVKRVNTLKSGSSIFS